MQQYITNIINQIHTTYFKNFITSKYPLIYYVILKHKLYYNMCSNPSPATVHWITLSSKNQDGKTLYSELALSK